MKEPRPYLAALRRGVALGLALVAVWFVSLTADLSALGGRLTALGEDSALAVSLMRAQLGASPGQASGLEGWGRLLLKQSSLLAAGEAAVLALREARAQSRPVPEPDLQEGDGEEDDWEAPDLQPPAGGDGVIEMTARGKQEGKYLWDSGVYVYNRTSFDLDVSVLSQGAVEVALGEGPQILIVHTHGSEAYSQTDGDRYEESDPYRTTDCTHNVVKVGEEMAAVFRAHGFQVVHDTALHDYPAYSGAYDRSKAAVEQWLEEYPTIQIVLDVHRDALVDSEGQVYKMVSEEAGQKVAQIMLVVGTDGAGADHPYWQNNLAFAVRLQREVVRGYADLARPIVLRSSAYNQHLLPGSLLVEVGGHGNTLSEAIAGARLWADNVSRTLRSMAVDGG